MPPPLPRFRSCARLLAALAMLLAVLAVPRPATALNFTCVEPSRYRNLLAIFGDDPNLFFSYFGLPRGKLPPTNGCRAILATGDIKDGDATALLKEIEAGAGWLAVLYLAADGTNLAEELRMAAIIRAFQLKTRTLRLESQVYGPDFVINWDSPVTLGGIQGVPPTAKEDPSPLSRGLRSYLAGRNLSFGLTRETARCDQGCRTLWHAGINRITLVGGTTPVPQGPDMALNRRRVGALQLMEFNRLPSPSDPLLAKPLEWNSLVPGSTARMLREKCSPEISVVEALETRWIETFEAVQKRNYGPTHVETLTSPFDALTRAGGRMQQCLSAAFESERLKAFEQLCPKGCDQGALTERFTARAREWLEAADRL